MYNYLLSIFFIWTLLANDGNKRVYIEANINLINEIALRDYDIYMPQSINLNENDDIVFFDRSIQKLIRTNLKSLEFNFYGEGEGRGPREFQRVWGIDVDLDGTIYISEMDKQKIVKWNLDGKYLGQYGIGGKYIRPSRIAVCKNNPWLYIISAQYSRSGIFHRYDKNGKLLNSFHKIESQIERLPYHTDGKISCDDYGNLYHAGTWVNTIKKFSPKGELIYEDEIFETEPNKDLVIQDGKWFEPNKNANIFSGDIENIDTKLAIAFSGNRYAEFNSIDFYNRDNATYLYSIKMPKKFENFAINSKNIVTLEEDDNGDAMLCIYSYELSF